MREGMNLFKRSYYSVIRRPIKSLVLTGILYGIAIFLVIAIAIYRQQLIVQNAIKNQVGASLRLVINYEDELRRIEQYQDVYNVYIGDNVTFLAPSDFYTIHRKDIEKISRVEGILEFNINASDFAVFPVNFERVTISEQDPWEMVNLRGVLNLKLIDEVSHEFIRLKEGRWIEEDDVTSQVAPLVISEELAQKNGLTVGDELNFEWRDMELDIILEALERERYESISLSGEIVGIFSVERPIDSLTDTFRIENTIFTHLNFREQAIESYDSYFYTLATFDVEDVEEYERVKADILNLDLNWERYNLIDADGMLEMFSQDFSALGQISILLFSVVMGSGFIMLLLVFTFWIRSRSHEIAIYLSLGIERITIVLQIICEALLISLAAFAFCLITLPTIPILLETNLSNLSIHQEGIDLDGILVTETGGIEASLSNHFYELALNEISVTINTLLIVIVVVILLIVISALVATIPIMKMKPREIFQK